jgi:Na+:H+ antiporter, NhaA family
VVKRVIGFLFESSGFLIAGSLVALVWINMVDHAGYEHFIHPLEFWVNDVLMCMFFGIAAKEIRESILPGGSLSSPRKAAMPLFSTLGGVVGPAFLYVVGCWLFRQPSLIRGCAIPCATDIAFSYLVARIVFGSRHPAIAFLLLLAVADDAIGLLIITTCYPTGDINLLLFSSFAGGAMCLGFIMTRFLKFTSFWPYLIGPGILSWFGFYWGGIHPALALVPIIFTMPHERYDQGVFVEIDHDSHSIDDALNNFEHWWKRPVEIILGLFGLVNAGVMLSSVNLVTGLVLFSLLVGKPLGIVSFALLGGYLFKLELPDGMNKKDLWLVGMAAAIGFTVALFMSTAAFPAGAALDGAKMGALLSFSAFFLVLIMKKVMSTQKNTN